MIAVSSHATRCSALLSAQVWLYPVAAAIAAAAAITATVALAVGDYGVIGGVRGGGVNGGGVSGSVNGRHDGDMQRVVRREGV